MLEGKIKRAAMVLYMSKTRDRVKLGEAIRKTFIEYTQKYAKMIARWHHKDGMAWDEECVNLLMDKPEKWNVIIGELWNLYKDWSRQSEQQQS